MHSSVKIPDTWVASVLLPTLDLAPQSSKPLLISADLLLDHLNKRGWLGYFQHLQAAQLGLAGYWWLASPNLQQAFGTDGAVLAYWLPGLDVSLTLGAEARVSLRHHRPELAAFAAVLFWLLLRQAQGARIKLSKLTLPMPPGVQTEFLTAFSHKLAFLPGSNEAILQYPLDVLEQPFITQNTQLLPMLSDALPFLRNIQSPQLTEKLYDLLSQVADLSIANQAWAAVQLAMSERTLTRQLGELGVSFRELLTRFRNGQAIRRLCEGESIDRLAEYLGFSERAAFERAFKSWQGITPAKFQSQYRRLSRDVDIEALISAERLPNMPAIGTQLLVMMQDDSASLESMAALVEQDPVLTAKLISIASSAYYGMKKSASIQEIVVRVFGVDKLRSLALAVLAAGSFKLRNCPAFSLKRFWLLSLGVAQLATDFYRKIGRNTEEQADIYLTGLLHNIGRLVLVLCFPVKMQSLLEPLQSEPPPQELLAMEKLRLGVDASEAGALLLAKWQLPRSVSVVMRQFSVDKIAMMPEAHLLLLAEEFLCACIEIEGNIDQQYKNVVAEHAPLFANLLGIDAAISESLLTQFSARLADLQLTADVVVGY